MTNSNKVNIPGNTVAERILSTAANAALEVNNNRMLLEYIRARARQEELKQAVIQCEDNFKRYRENVIEKFGEG